MNLLAPAALVLSALAIPIILFYMLKLRRRAVAVSSTLLWQMVLRDRQANAPWQRLRRNLLLLLQLLILAALILALARPALSVPALASGSSVLILDASASMNATDVTPTRFAAAKRAAQATIDALPGDAPVTVIVAGQQPQVIASAETDRNEIKRSLDEAQPTNGTANWNAALALAASALSRQADQPTTIIISDGGLPQNLPPLPGEVRYVPIGQSSDNVSIAALSLRPTKNGAELFASVTNNGDTDHSVILSIYRGDALLNAQTLDLKAGETQHVILNDLPRDPAIYQAKLSRPDQATQPVDALPLDDAAFAINNPAGSRRVLLVSQGNVFLEQLLAAMPDLQAFRAIPQKDGSLVMPQDQFDLYILDGIVPDDLPFKPILLINPPQNSILRVNGVFSNTANARVNNSPMTREVSWANVHVREAKHIDLPQWAKTLVDSDGGPLVLVGDTGVRRVGAITFDLHDSDLPLQVTFPILLVNLINYLAPGRSFDVPDGVAPGSSVIIRPDPSVDTVAIASPSNQIYTVHPSGGEVVFKDTQELGAYGVTLLSGDQQAIDYFAVNLFDPAESNIRPADSIRVGQSQITSAKANETGWQEWWPWLAALALVILLIEWWVYHGRKRL
ncbi:MAG TPA: VWA domain-containing protein [Anaerolineae bacterium]|nr:VWA domain-containing protein [Anaerolineae bacterium]